MPEPNRRFDIDALFAHLTENLEHDPEDELEWHFDFRSDDVERLARVGESLADEFEVYLQEEVEEITEEGSSIGPPLLSVVVQAALSPDEVKELAARFAALAQEQGLTYEGVSSYEPFDEEAAFGWLDLEAAQWRLRHFTDVGVVEGEPLPFVFAIEADSGESLHAAAAALEVAGFPNIELIEDDDGMGVVVHVDGRNDEAMLTSVYRQIEAIATGAGAELAGVQFFEDDDEEDELGEEDEDEDGDGEDAGEDRDE